MFLSATEQQRSKQCVVARKGNNQHNKVHWQLGGGNVCMQEGVWVRYKQRQRKQRCTHSINA